MQRITLRLAQLRPSFASGGGGGGGGVGRVNYIAGLARFASTTPPTPPPPPNMDFEKTFTVRIKNDSRRRGTGANASGRSRNLRM